MMETIEVRKKYAVKLPDAIIAATCIENNCQIIKNNTKDFDKITGLSTIQIDFLKFS